MYFIGAILIIAGLIVFLAVKLARKAKRNKESKESYNGFHLGEMTGHDVTRNYSKDTKYKARYSSQKNKEEKDYGKKEL